MENAITVAQACGNIITTIIVTGVFLGIFIFMTISSMKWSLERDIRDRFYELKSNIREQGYETRREIWNKK